LLRSLAVMEGSGMKVQRSERVPLPADRGWDVVAGVALLLALGGWLWLVYEGWTFLMGVVK